MSAFLWLTSVRWTEKEGWLGRMKEQEGTIEEISLPPSLNIYGHNTAIGHSSHHSEGLRP